MGVSREKDLVKNTIILSIGKFLPSISSFVTLPILTSCLTKAEYGTYDLISTLVMLVIPIATLQIQSAAFRFLIECRGNKAMSSSIISNIFAATIPITVICSLIIYLLFWGFDFPVRLLISIYFVLDTIHSTLGQIARGIGDNKAFSIGSIILSAVYMIGIIIGVGLSKAGLLGVVGALVIAQFLGTLYLIKKVNLFSYVSLSLISKRQIKALLAYSWPMVPNNLSSWILKLSDRFVITGFLGVEANAIYAAANKIPNILSMAQSIMVMAWQENASIAAKDKDADEYYSKMLDRFFCLMFGCTALLIAGTPLLFWLLIKGDYSESYYQMPVLILAMFFYVMSSYFGGIYIAYKKTVNVGISTMVAAAINLTIDLAFVNLIGIWAGSISTLAAYTVLYFYRMLNCQKFQPMKINYAKHTVLILILIVLLISCFMQNMLLNVVNIVVAVLVFLVFNREIAKQIINIVVCKLCKNRRKTK